MHAQFNAFPYLFIGFNRFALWMLSKAFFLIIKFLFPFHKSIPMADVTFAYMHFFTFLLLLLLLAFDHFFSSVHWILVFYRSSSSSTFLSVCFCFHSHFYNLFSDMKGSTTFVYSINSFGSTQLPSAPKGISFFCVFIKFIFVFFCSHCTICR